MNLFKFWIFTGLVLIFSIKTISGQKNQLLDRVYLHSQSIISGTITDLDDDRIVILTHESGLSLSFPMNLVEKYEIGVPTYPLRRDPFATDRSKQWYFSLQAGLMSKGRTTYNFWGGEQEALQAWFAEAAVGYTFTRSFGMGIAFGKAVYHTERSEMAYPVSLEVKGFFSDHHFSPYYRLNGGLTSPGIFFIKPKDLVRNSGKGWFIKPALGVSWAVNENWGVHLEFGNYIGKSTFYSFDRWRGLKIDEVDLRRWTLGFGVSYQIRKEKEKTLSLAQ